MLVAIIQARMSSSRLPGKVLLDLGGKPVLQWVIDAARNSTLIDKIVVATSEEESDNVIEEYMTDNWNEEDPVFLFRGSMDDVLDRYYRAAIYHNASHIIRLSADSPLLESNIIDDTIQHHLAGDFDYTWNRPGFLSGYDVEVFTMDTLIRATKLATSKIEKEHVGPIMRDVRYFKSGRYDTLGLHHRTEDLKEKYSIDTQEDLERIRGLINCSKIPSSS